MNKVWFWLAARLLLVVALVGGMRLSLGLVAARQLASVVETMDQVAIAVDEGIPLDGAAPSKPGDPGRADQPIHPDLEREGQVVVRNGKKVVLVDASDPGNEVWIELGDAAEAELPWLLRDGWGPTVGSVAGAALIYAIGSLLFGLRSRSDP